MITPARLETLLSEFSNRTIGLIGDLFLDRYLEIDAALSEMSIETGLEAHQVTTVRNVPGALGTVMNNLAALGVGTLVPATVIGADGHGYDLVQSLGDLPVDPSGILRDATRLTPTYTKPLQRAGKNEPRELNRLDVRTRAPLSNATLERLAPIVREVFERCDGVIVLDQISDPNCGVVHSRIRRLLQELQQSQPSKLIFVDSRAQLSQFRFGTLKGNEAEIRASVEGELDVEAAATRLSATTGETVFVTRGEKGMLVVTADGSVTSHPARLISGPVDIVGAGDAATSALVASLLSGASAVEAAAVANLAASITVQQLGTTGTASPRQLRDALNS